MSFRGFIIKRFVCNCNENHGIKKVRVMEGNKVVGKCLKCNKRVFGTMIFNIRDDVESVQNVEVAQDGTEVNK